jgi:hypothetical protein
VLSWPTLSVGWYFRVGSRRAATHSGMDVRCGKAILPPPQPRMVTSLSTLRLTAPYRETNLGRFQMWANKILDSLIRASDLVVVPIQVVFMIPLGFLVLVTLGLYLYPVDLIWMTLFLGPLIGLSWVWGNFPLLRIPAAILGIPAAFLGNAYAAIMPSIGTESRITRTLVCRTWPFSLQFRAFRSAKTAPTPDLEQILSRLASTSHEISRYLGNL